jgi:aryl-alcohol dehydrogenase-like predicted oxidoreductase
MRTQTFGRRTGLRVSEYALGTSNFGSSDTSIGITSSRNIFDDFVAAGGTTFDTSDIYQNGRAETVLGELLGSDRDEFVVITKYSGTRQDKPRPGTTGNSRKSMIRSLEASLRRLRTDYVDVFMPHFPDEITPMEEIMSALGDLVQAGKVIHGGLSNFPAWRVAGAAVMTDLRGLSPLAGIETEYSLAERSAERELLPMAAAHGLGLLSYAPLAGGLLSGKYRRGETGRLSGRAGSVEDTAQQTAVVDAVLAVAEEIESTAVQVSLAWLRRRATLAHTALIPVIGPRSREHLTEYLRSLDLLLDDVHYRRLDAVSSPRMGAPHDGVTAALENGFDGDRTLLALPAVPVV